MQPPIELSLDSPSGLIDIRIDPDTEDDRPASYSVTILYPNMAAGISRSDIFVHTMLVDPSTGAFHFLDDEKGIHPKVRAVEAEISAAIVKSQM